MITVDVRHGHAITELRKLSAGSHHMCVTSPPYWGLRDYKTPTVAWEEVTFVPMPGVPEMTVPPWEGHLGLEPDPMMFVGHIVAVFREVKRVLRPEGTLWLNFGDCFATGAGAVGNCPGGGEQGARWKGEIDKGQRGGHEGKHKLKKNATWSGQHPGRMKNNGLVTNSGAAYGPMTQPNRLPIAGLKAKDLVGIPWRVAFALQADGWWLRMDNVWNKPNPMPESVTDRPTKAHEYLFLFAKSEKYFCDMEALKEPVTGSEHDNSRTLRTSLKSAPTEERNGIRVRSGNKERKFRGDHGGVKGSRSNQGFGVPWEGATRNKRSVWTVATAPYPEAHFATFPPDLIRPCILAGSSAKGCCRKCGAPWVRVVEAYDTGKTQKMPDGFDTGAGGHGSFHRNGRQKGETGKPVMANKTTGWRASCDCEVGEVVPCAVLDCFGGSGTTGQVAMEEGRTATLIELGEHHLPLIDRRCAITGSLPGLV